jgi:hypothetical protein
VITQFREAMTARRYLVGQTKWYSKMKTLWSDVAHDVKTLARAILR